MKPTMAYNLKDIHGMNMRTVDIPADTPEESFKRAAVRVFLEKGWRLMKADLSDANFKKL